MAEPTVTEPEQNTKEAQGVIEVESIAVRFAGDSGDGSQLIGSEFANTSAIIGNDLHAISLEIAISDGQFTGQSALDLARKADI